MTEKLNSIEQSQYSEISLFFGNLHLSCIRGKTIDADISELSFWDLEKLCNIINNSSAKLGPPGSSIHEVLQAWVAISFSNL